MRADPNYQYIALLDQSTGERYGSVTALATLSVDEIVEAVREALPEGWTTGHRIDAIDLDGVPEGHLLWVRRPPIQKIEVTLVLGKEMGS